MPMVEKNLKKNGGFEKTQVFVGRGRYRQIKVDNKKDGL